MTVAEYLLEQEDIRWDAAGNDGLDPGKLTLGSHRKVRWLCEKGHGWEAPVYSVAANGCGCPYCGGKQAIPGENDLATLHPELMTQWDGEKNTLDPRQVLPGSHDKVWWLCEKGHSWQAMPFSRTRENGSGCPYCTGKKVLAGFNDLATLRPKVARQWHPTLNGRLQPTEVTLGSNKKVWWRCGERHVWQAAVYSRTRERSSGCPVCAGTVRRPAPVIPHVGNDLVSFRQSPP